jgi:hypothetical protein
MLAVMRLLEQLVELEERLLGLGPACDMACVESLMTEEFVEFGSSGRMWTRATILDELARTPARNFVLSGATCYIMSDTSALLTYRLTLNDRRSLRSSLWVHRDGRWQMLFHQGTVAAVQS